MELEALLDRDECGKVALVLKAKLDGSDLFVRTFRDIGDGAVTNLTSLPVRRTKEVTSVGLMVNGNRG